MTSSFRMSQELQRELSDVAERTGKGKNAIIIEALVKHLHALERESLAEEARRQSELISRNEQDVDWYGLSDRFPRSCMPALPVPFERQSRVIPSDYNQ